MSPPFTYVAFGDSITDGYGVMQGFVHHVARRLAGHLAPRETVTINRGMSGENSSDAIYRLERDVLDHDPDLVTINFGVNDAFSWVSAEKFAGNLTAMVEAIRDNGCRRVVLVSSEVIPEPRAEEQVQPYWGKMRQVAEDTGTVYADANGFWRQLVAAGTDQWTLIIPGDMHPNDAGHEIIADAVWQAIVDSELLEESD